MPTSVGMTFQLPGSGADPVPEPRLNRPLHSKSWIDRKTFVDDLDAGDPRQRRALFAAAEHVGNRFGLSAEKRFYGAVPAVAHPTVEAECVGFICDPCSKAHALNATFDADMHGPER